MQGLLVHAVGQLADLLAFVKAVSSVCEKPGDEVAPDQLV